MALPFDRDIESMDLYQPGERVTMAQPENVRMITQESKNGRLTCQPKTLTLTEEELNRIERPNREQKSSFGKMSSFTIDSTNSNVDLKLIGKDEGLSQLLMKIPEANDEPSDSDVDDITETTVRAAYKPNLNQKNVKSKRRY